MRVFSFDAEPTSLTGSPFAIAAVVRHNGTTVDRLQVRCPPSQILSNWTGENVLPVIDPPALRDAKIPVL